jgi:hypothetical protein
MEMNIGRWMMNSMVMTTKLDDQDIGLDLVKRCGLMEKNTRMIVSIIAS